MKDLNIKAPDGYEIDQENSDLSTGVIRFKEKDGLVKSWWDLERVHGYYTDEESEVISTNHVPFSSGVWKENRNTWATKEQAEASIAMAMLSQLMKQANGDWTPDWKEGESYYAITFDYGKVVKAHRMGFSCFLAFESEEIRDEFLELHRDLIEKAKPLL